MGECILGNVLLTGDVGDLGDLAPLYERERSPSALTGVNTCDLIRMLLELWSTFCSRPVRRLHIAAKLSVTLSPLLFVTSKWSIESSFRFRSISCERKGARTIERLVTRFRHGQAGWKEEHMHHRGPHLVLPGHRGI